MAFTLFGLTPVFEKRKRFLHRPEYRFKNESGGEVKFTPVDLIFFLLEKDAEPASEIDPVLFTPAESYLDVCREYLQDVEITVTQTAEVLFHFTLTKFAYNQNGEVSIEQTSRINSELDAAIRGVCNKYLEPLVLAEEEAAYEIKQSIVKVGKRPEAKIQLSLLDNLRFHLWIAAFKGPNELPRNDDERKDLTDIRKAANIYLRLISFYVTDVSVSPPNNGSVNVEFTIDLANDTRIEKDQIDAILQEFINSKLFTDAIAKITAKGYQPKLKNAGSFRKSGHLSRFELGYPFKDKKKKGPTQGELWNGLAEQTRNRIKESGYEESVVTEGINLDGSDRKLINCFCKLLHERSQNTDPDKRDFYAGNRGLQEVRFGLDAEFSPTLAFTMYELTKEFVGGDSLQSRGGGKAVENVSEILSRLAEKKFLFSYERKIPKPDGGYTKKKIETFSPLFKEYKLSQAEYRQNDSEIEGTRRQEKVIILHPIFRDQIDSNFILYPNDLNRRLMIAFGDPNVSDQAAALVEWLIAQKSFKRPEAKLDKERLFAMLCHKLLKAGKKGRASERIKKAVETAKTLGIITEYKEQPAAGGEGIVAIFTLDLKWN